MSIELGHQVEQHACRYLESNGLRLIDKNFNCKSGEIDLIMQDGETLVFVEVRYRAKSKYGDSLDSVTRSKQNKIIRTAKYYLQQNDLYDKVPCRFDVIAVDEQINNQVTWIKDAFWVKY
jgi:putative endonuclease